MLPHFFKEEEGEEIESDGCSDGGAAAADVGALGRGASQWQGLSTTETEEGERGKVGCSSERLGGVGWDALR